MKEAAPRFVASSGAPDSPPRSARWCLFREGKIAIRRNGGRADFPQLARAPDGAHFLGMLDEEPCFASVIREEEALPEGTELVGLRPLIFEGDETISGVAGLAFQVLEWDRTHRYCGSCGAPTESRGTHRARACRTCRVTYYPRIQPVVQGLVVRDRELLLTRKPATAAGRYTVVAGFVEPGETLEHAVIREVKEETGVDAVNPRYLASQPWPFPNSLVAAFTLDYAGGEAKADGVELEDARWFDIDHLPPQLPERVAISRQLIDSAIARLRSTPT